MKPDKGLTSHLEILASYESRHRLSLPFTTPLCLDFRLLL